MKKETFDKAEEIKLSIGYHKTILDRLNNKVVISI